MSKQISAVIVGNKMQVTFRNETREFDARRHPVHDYYDAPCVFSGRVGRTGTKNWPVRVVLWDSGNIALDGGRSNKGGVTGIIGWFNQDSRNNCQAKGQR